MADEARELIQELVDAISGLITTAHSIRLEGGLSPPVDSEPSVKQADKARDRANAYLRRTAPGE